MTIIGLIVCIVCAIVCGLLASRKNRSVVGWAILGFFFSWIALIIIALLKPKN